jgi:dTDP-4-amino-4,6-dideoxygalactose transaminase
MNSVIKKNYQMTERNIEIKSSKPDFPATDRKKISREISKILASGHLTQGPWVEKFERAFAKYCQVEYSIATNSGTSALEILLRYFGVKDGEVIVPTNTFPASANAVIFAGGKPVLTDISPETLCITLNEIKKYHSKKTCGVMVVHIAGLICPEIEAIRQYCRENDLFLIEDAAHAAGAAIGGEKAGALGDGGAFSFYPTKPMTTGEGGMITTNSSSCDEFARSIRCHGIVTGEDLKKYERNMLIRLGYNWRMSEIQALLGFFQLERLDRMIEERNRVARQYYKLLEGVEGVSVYQPAPNFTSSFYKFPLKLDSGFNREKIMRQMKDRYSISCGSIYYPPCHLQPFYRERCGYSSGDFPAAENILSQTIALPIHPGLSNGDIQRIAAALQNCLI